MFKGDTNSGVSETNSEPLQVSGYWVDVVPMDKDVKKATADIRENFPDIEESIAKAMQVFATEGLKAQNNRLRIVPTVAGQYKLAFKSDAVVNQLISTVLARPHDIGKGMSWEVTAI